MRTFQIIQNALTVLDRTLGRSRVGGRTFTRPAPESEPPTQRQVTATPEPTANDALIYYSPSGALNAMWNDPERWDPPFRESLPHEFRGSWLCQYCGRPNFADRLHCDGCQAQCPEGSPSLADMMFGNEHGG